MQIPGVLKKIAKEQRIILIYFRKFQQTVINFIAGHIRNTM